MFPTFSNELIQDIENNSSIQSYKRDVIMRTGQYINNTMLVTKDFFWEGENGGVLNVLFTARTSLRRIMICPLKVKLVR
jgi:hypothetical protein